MRAQLDHAVDAGEVASLLIAAEWPIYGRYGYGPCSDWVAWEVDTAIAEISRPGYGSVRLVDAHELDKAAAIVLARHQEVTPGDIVRPENFRAVGTGVNPRPWDKHEGRVRIVHYDDAGEPDAYAQYDPKERWDGMRPQNRLEVDDLCAVSPTAELELWRYLIDVDLVDVVKWDGDVSSPLRYAFTNGRAVKQTGRWDYIWARILDVPACLTARSYDVADQVVIDVVDEFMDRGGRFALDASPSGTTCAPAGTAPADLTLDVATLGAAWLGGTDLRVLAAGGGLWAVDEHTPGALDRLAALLAWNQAPNCATGF
jgi:predicted acetyltransferase